MPTVSTGGPAVGSAMPAFTLLDVCTRRPVASSALTGAVGTVVVFLCRHCPYVVHMRDELVAMARAFSEHGVSTVLVSSNDVERYPDDSPERLREMAHGWGLPMLFDENQDVARAFGAVCTPDLFVYRTGDGLFYRGRFDESTPGNGKPVTGADLRGALEALVAGRPAPQPQPPALGCSIKWKA